MRFACGLNTFTFCQSEWQQLQLSTIWFPAMHFGCLCQTPAGRTVSGPAWTSPVLVSRVMPFLYPSPLSSHRLEEMEIGTSPVGNQGSITTTRLTATVGKPKAYLLTKVKEMNLIQVMEQIQRRIFWREK